MLIVCISLFISILLLIFPEQGISEPLQTTFVHGMLGMSLFLLFINILIQCFTWRSLQNATALSTTVILELYAKDKRIFYTLWTTFLFPIVTILIALSILYFSIGHPDYWYALWTTLFGITLAATRDTMSRAFHYINPYKVTKFFTENSSDLDQKIKLDALSEIALKSIDSYTPSLAMESIDSLQRTLSHSLKKQQDPAQLNYQITYCLNLLEHLYERSLNGKIEPICSKIITTLGNIALDTVEQNLPLGNYPIHLIGNFALTACDTKLPILAEKSTCTLLAIGKTLIESSNSKAIPREIYYSIINNMDKISKKIFQNDKATSIVLLLQPFQELKNMFEKGKGTSYPDKTFVIGELERVIDQFEQLQLIMKKIPPINLEEEK